MNVPKGIPWSTTFVQLDASQHISEVESKEVMLTDIVKVVLRLWPQINAPQHQRIHFPAQHLYMYSSNIEWMGAVILN